MVTLYLSVLVLLPLAAVASQAFDHGLASFWEAVTAPESVAALKLTVIASLITVVINGVFGTIIAWVLVRDRFRGKAILNAVIDLPFALPTIVAGITLIALYGRQEPDRGQHHPDAVLGGAWPCSSSLSPSSSAPSSPC